MTTETKYELEPEEDILAFVHNKRKLIINDMLEKGVPNDIEDKRVLLTALKDMDSSALGRKRIKLEEKSNANQEAAAGIISQILARTQGSKPYMSAEPSNKPAPVLPVDIPTPTLVDGEIAIVSKPQSIDDFLTNNEQ